MLHSLQKRNLVDRFKAALTLGLPVFIVLLLVPGHSMAQSFTGQSCNPKLNFTILTQPPFFEGDALRVSANLGAGDIGGNVPDDEKWLQIDTFGFALNCNAGQTYQSCTSAGHTVEFIDIVSTTCMNSNGQPANILHPESNIIPFKSAVYPIQTGPNETCNLQFDIRVDELNGVTNTVRQSMGWPLEGEPAAVCSNGGTTTATANIAFNVSTCDIDLNKQVSVNGEDWFNADSAEAAPELLLGGDAQYRLIVTNTGTVDFVQPISVVDAALGIDTTIPALAPGASVTLDGDDIANLTAQGHCQIVDTLQNTASVQGVCRAGDSPVSASAQDSAYLVCTGAASIDIEKATNGQDADSPTGPSIAVGGPVTWTYVVTNDGSLPLSNVAVSDSDIGAIVCPKSSLAVGESMNCSANGTAVAGQYANTGSVTADSAGGAVNDSDDSHYFGAAPALSLVKTGSGPDDDYDAVGDVLSYSYLVTNTGNVSLAGPVVVTDDKSDDESCPAVSTVGNNDDDLDPGESITCTASYTVTQADVNAGSVTNTAFATAGGTQSNNDDETLNAEQGPALSLVKTATPQVYDAAGDVIGYSYLVTNTGNVSLAGPVVVTDDKSDDESCPAVSTVGNIDANLDPGEAITCTASYAITGPDVTAGSVTNTAYATAGGTQSNTDDETVYAIGIKVLKQIWNGSQWLAADDAASAPAEHFPAGALYRIIVENTGAADLENVVVNDPTLGIVNYQPIGAGGAGKLAAGETVTILAAELPALDQSQATVCDESGDFKNTATASGNSTGGGSVQDSDDAYLKCVGTPDLTVKKEISIDGGDTWIDGTAGPVDFPSGALYRITVENTGSVKLVNVTVSDTLIGPPNHLIGTLEIGETVVVADGVIEVGDSDWSALDVAEVCDSSGLIENIASATGTSDELASDEVTRTDNAKLECIGPPMIAVKKEVSLDNGDSWDDANGQPFPTAVTDPLNPVTALYRITVTNIGDVALTGVLVNDTTLGIVNYAPIGAGGPGVLAVGESVEIDSGDLPVMTVQDRCATTGEKANVASAEGSSAAGTKDEATDSATVECMGEAAIRITKEVSSDGVNFADVSTSAIAPSDAWYRITVENIGAVALENVVISDTILGLTDVVVTGAGGAGELAVGETVVITHVGGGGDNELADLYVPGLCTVDEDFVNTAIAAGKSVASVQTVVGEDDATFFCTQVLNLCEDGKPASLKLQYDADSDSSHSQGSGSVTISPPNAVFPAGAVRIVVTDHKDKTEVFAGSVSPGGVFWVSGPQKLISSSYWFRIYTADGETLLQTVNFHTSCSESLNVGDEFGAITVLGGTHSH